MFRLAAPSAAINARSSTERRSCGLRADRDSFAQCLASKLLTYALGRGIERYDRSTVGAITKQTATHDYRFSTLVTEIANSPPFQMRRGDRLE